MDDELKDEEDVDDEDEEEESKYEDVDDEVSVEVSDVVERGSDTSRCWRCTSSVVGGVVIVVLESIGWVDAVNGCGSGSICICVVC